MRLIDAEALVIFMSKRESTNCSPMQHRGYEDMLDAVAEATTIDAKPVVHGKWIISDFSYNGDKYWRFNCSECGATNTCRYEDSKFDYWANRYF